MLSEDYAALLQNDTVAACMTRLEQLDRFDSASEHNNATWPLGGVGDAALEANALAPLDDTLDRGRALDGVAATLYAFGRRPHLFHRSFRSMTFLLAAVQAHRSGHLLVPRYDELNRLLMRLATDDSPSFSEVRAWVKARLIAVIGGPMLSAVG